MTIATEVLATLAEKERFLTFCDDSDIDGNPIQGFEKDFRVLCAIKIRSENYAQLATAFKERLTKRYAPACEFHATEIVNPNRKSLWYKVPICVRLDAFDFLRELLEENTESLYYCYCSKEQYKTLKKEAEKKGEVNVNFKAGLKKVFLRSLFGRLAETSIPSIVVMDDDDNKKLPPRVESWPEGKFLVGGGPIVARSHDIEGLQLADFAVYAITRYLRTRENLLSGDATKFDQLAAQAIGDLGERVECLLNSSK